MKLCPEHGPSRGSAFASFPFEGNQNPGKMARGGGLPGRYEGQCSGEFAFPGGGLQQAVWVEGSRRWEGQGAVGTYRGQEARPTVGRAGGGSVTTTCSYSPPGVRSAVKNGLRTFLKLARVLRKMPLNTCLHPRPDDGLECRQAAGRRAGTALIEGQQVLEPRRPKEEALLRGAVLPDNADLLGDELHLWH